MSPTHLSPASITIYPFPTILTQGTTLVFIEGEVKPAEKKDFKVSLAKHNEMVEISVDIIAPETAGYKTGIVQANHRHK